MKLGTRKVRNQKNSRTMESTYHYDGLTPHAYKFTGKERDTESGNDYFGARYYASTMGRWMTPDPLNLTSARLVNPTNTLNKYVYGGNNPLKYIDRDGEDITVFYRPPSGASGDYGHIFIAALNQQTGQTGFLDYYPKNGTNGLGQGAGTFNTGDMQSRAAEAAAGKFATLTIQTSPEEAQKVLNQISAMTSGPAPNYSAVFGSNCTTVCEDVLHDLGLDFGDRTPSGYWDDLYRRYSQDAADNPFKIFAPSSSIPRQTGREYGFPRYGLNYSQLLFQLYLNQWNQQNNQQKPTRKACVTAGGETTCENY
jgi:RHS repeat-associated protein